MKTDLTSRSRSYANIVGLIIAILSVNFLLAWFWFQNEKNKLFADIELSQEAFLSQASHILTKSLEKPVLDVKYIAELVERGGLDPEVDSLHFASLIDSQNGFYDQIRVLDNSGQEVLRVDKTPFGAKIIEDALLQNKAGRYYVREAFKLQREQVWLSDIDLNVENDEIEIPYQPTIRVIKQFHDQNQQQLGYVVLNVDLTKIFSDISEIRTKLKRKMNIWLVNEAGYWLMGPDELTWGFMFTDRANMTLGHLYPDLYAELLLSNETDGLFVDDLLVSSIRINNELQGFESVVFSPKSSYINVLAVKDPEALTEGLALITHQAKKVFLVISVICIVLMLLFRRLVLTRLRISRQLTEEKNKMLSMFEAAPDAILICDEKGIITYVNTQVEHMFGYTDAELLGEPIEKLVPLDKRKEHVNKREQASKQTGVRPMGTGSRLQALCKSGALLDVDINLSIYPVGNVTNSLAIVRDVSSLKAIEQLKEDALIKAEQNAKARADFLANMSHEIRTPINGIMGMLHLLADTQLDERQQHFTQQSKKSAEALLRIINDILDISKIDSGRLELIEQEIDLEEVMLDVGRTLEPLAQEKGIELHCPSGISSPLKIMGDGVRLRQILINLVGNAIKFTESGHIIVRADFVVDDSDTVYTTLTIVDTGIGMTDEFVAQAFERFSQFNSSTTREKSGSGLGLAITSELVNMMNGTVALESKVGEGTTFTIQLKFNLASVTKKPLPQFDSDIQLVTLVKTGVQFEVLHEMASSWRVNCERVESIDLLSSQSLENVILLADLALLTDADIKLLNQLKASLKGLIFLQSSNLDPSDVVMQLPDCILIKPVSPSELFNALNKIANGHLSAAPHQASLPLTALQGQVLVVEDDLINREVVNALLMKNGLTVANAKNGQEAIDMISQNSFDLVLMDCQMPVMDGYNATREVRAGSAGESKKSLPIIALTANALRGDEELCIAAGMDDYLSKPIEPESLFNMLAKYLKESK